MPNDDRNRGIIGQFCGNRCGFFGVTKLIFKYDFHLHAIDTTSGVYFLSL